MDKLNQRKVLKIALNKCNKTSKYSTTLNSKQGTAMRFVYIEEVLKLLVNNKCPAKIVDFFDSSSLLIGFNYCCQNNRFTHVSSSFKDILGYEIDNIVKNNNFLDKIIHPHDRSAVQQYLCEIALKDQMSVNEIEFSIPHIKCRCKHIKGYWKYLIFFSIKKWNDNTNSINKTGLIAEEHITSFLHSISNGRDRSFKSSFYSKRRFKENNSQRSKISVSHREIEILELIGKGMIAKGIADKLNISTSTVITHRKNLITKFHARNTAELVKLSTQLMLV